MSNFFMNILGNIIGRANCSYCDNTGKRVGNPFASTEDMILIDCSCRRKTFFIKYFIYRLLNSIK